MISAPLHHWSLAALVGCMGSAANAALPPPEQTVAYIHATLVDPASGIATRNMSIITRGARVLEVRSGDSGSIGVADERIDLHDRFVIPGLVNTHVHTATLAVPAVAHAYLRRELYSGVTTVRDMAGDVRLLGELKREAEFDEIPSPDIFYVAVMAGPAFFVDPRTHDAARGRVPGQAPWMQAVTDQTNLPLAIAAARGTGATAIKIYGDLSASLVGKIVAEAHRQQLLAWSHAAVFPALPNDIASAGVDVMSHACLLGYQFSSPPLKTNEDRTPVDAEAVSRAGASLDSLLANIRSHGIILDATLYPYALDEAPSASCSGELSSLLARKAWQAGIPISVGTDDDPDWQDPDSALDRELLLLVEKTGMSPADALRSSTLIGARAAGQEKQVGSIEAGKLANMVVLDKNPLLNIANVGSVYMVVKHGIRYPRSAYTPVTAAEMKQYPQ